MKLRYCRALSAVMVVLLFMGCDKSPGEGVSSAPVVADASDLIKAKVDNRRYRPLLLGNGLKVLLVSDPDTSKAAVSLNVDVGSSADPVGREGLAHFVEHMLFLGTEKYPEADSYQRFISAQGGEHNAYTSFNDTNYFFDVNAAALEPALDRFAQFFISPLFTEAYLGRERLAVDSEYKARIQNEVRRYLDVLKTQINVQHPFHRFTIGSEQTLSVEGLSQVVRQFYSRFYAAKNMSLVVAGADSLDDLEAMVSTRFSAVAAGQPNEVVIRQPLFVSDGPKLLFIKPLKDRRSVNISFEIPDLSSQNLDKPLQLFGHLLGHEGESSLFQYLKAKSWAESLSAGTFLDYPGGGLFSVNISLTELGSKYVDSIIAIVFAEIRALAATPDLAERYAELSKIADLQFDYQASPKLLPYTRSLAASLSDYPRRYWLKGNYAMLNYDASLAAKLLTKMSPERAIISIVEPSLVPNAESPWFNVGYRVGEVSGDQLRQWRETALSSAIKFPVTNPYIPASTEIIQIDSPVPALIDDAPGFRVWQQSVNRFGVPKGTVRATLNNSHFGSTASHAVVFAVAAKMLNDKLNRSVYDAKAMGYDTDVSAGHFGLELRVSGFDQKLALLLEQLVGGIKQVQWDQSEFNQSRDELIRRWRNFAMEPPYQQLMNQQQADFVAPYWTTTALVDAAEQLNFADFISAWQQLSQFDFVEALVLGNIDQGAGKLLAQKLSVFKPRTAALIKPKPQVASASSKQALQRFAVKSDDHAAVIYIQSAQLGLRARAMTALTARILESSFFHELRTEQQLGYIVFLTNRLLEDQPGLMMVVQSPGHDADQITAAMRQYWDAVLAGEIDISEQDFTQHKQSLAETLLKPPINNNELLERVWRDIDRGYADFDQLQQLVDALATISYDDWLASIKRLWLSETDAKISYVTD